MKILGWIRYGDKAACGGTVVEACSATESHGRPLTFHGARMACRKLCVIVEAHPMVTLPNGRNVPHHGHVTTGGCPLISTLNDVHGWMNESGEPVPDRYMAASEGEWIPIYQEHHKAPNQEYDQHVLLVDEETAKPVDVPFEYIIKGEHGEAKGHTAIDGKTGTYGTDVPSEIEMIAIQKKIKI